MLVAAFCMGIAFKNQAGGPDDFDIADVPGDKVDFRFDDAGRVSEAHKVGIDPDHIIQNGVLQEHGACFATDTVNVRVSGRWGNECQLRHRRGFDRRFFFRTEPI